MPDAGEICPSCGEPIDSHLTACPACGRDPTSTATTQAAVATAVRDAPHLTDFEIIRMLGRGGMGTVYEAYQVSMHRRVALKVLGYQPTITTAERFEREAWIGGRLAHPHIVRVYDKGTEGGIAYLAMELVEGQSLHVLLQRLRVSRSLLSSGVRLAHIRRMLSLFTGVVDALEHAHRNGVVHRDIKPHNLLVSTGDRMFLSDFGVARDAQERALTKRGDFLGTIRYMSPEQLQAQRVTVDHRTDIWSMGVSLYEAVTLDLPFPGETDEAYIGSITTRDSVPARKRNRAITRDLETILLKCLERDPGRRYPTAAALRDDLQRCLEDRPVLARRPGMLLRSARFARRHRASVAVAVAAALVTSGALVSGVQFRDEARGLVAQLSLRDEARDREQILATLQRIATHSTFPEQIDPEWYRLSSKVRRMVRRDPKGELARLALSASCGVESLPAPFGLIAEPPSHELVFMSLFDPGVEAYCIVDVDSSWDNGPWRQVASGDFPIDGRTGPEIVTVSTSAQTAGPHTLAFRVNKFIVEITPESDALGRRRGLSDRLRIFMGLPVGSAWQFMKGSDRLPDRGQVVRDRAIVRNTVRLGPSMVSLFDALPPEFPQKLPPRSTQIVTWQPETARLLRLVVPDGVKRCWGQQVSLGSSSLLKEWWSGRGPLNRVLNGGRLSVGQCLPDNFGPGERLVTAVQLLGPGENMRLVNEPMDTPLAGNATLTVAMTGQPSFQFTLALGEGYAWIDGKRVQFPMMGATMKEFDPVQGDFHRAIDSRKLHIPLQKLLDPPLRDAWDVPDGTYNGRLVLEPSRDVALLTKRLDGYLGDALVYDLSVEVSTQRPEWSAPLRPPIDPKRAK